MEDQPLTTQRPFLPPCQWNLIQFGLMCSYTMGLHAISRFPHLVYKHTGLFLVAYYILLVLICIPVTFIQLKLGGILKKGIVRIFSHYMPALKGVAVSILLVSFIQCIYWNVYIGYSIYYMFAAVKQPFVWSIVPNATERIEDNYVSKVESPAQYYFHHEFLQATASISEPGTVPWYQLVCLLVSWLLVFLCIFRGPSWFGKVVYVTSPLAIVLLFVLLIYSHAAIPTAYDSLGHFFRKPSLDGAKNGHSLDEDKADILKSELASPMTWISALEQHLYSLGLWAGLLPTLGAHLGNKKPASNLTWLIVLLVHSMLPHLGTIAIAPFVHALAVRKGMHFEDVIKSGHVLLFQVLPEAFVEDEISPLWAVLFYILFILFVLHQQALLLIVIMENIVEGFPQYTKTIFRRREFLAAALCTSAFLLGLPQITQGGLYLRGLIYLYMYRFIGVLIILSIFPTVLAYVKIEAYHLPIERIFICGWYSLASLVVCGLLIYKQIILVAPYSNDIRDWVRVLGLAIAIGPIVLGLTAGFIHALTKPTETGCKRLTAIFRPNPVALVPPVCADLEINGTLGGEGDSSTLKRRRKLAKQAATEAAAAAAAALSGGATAPMAEMEVTIPAPSNGEIVNV